MRSKSESYKIFLKRILVILLLAFSINASAQSTISIKYLGLTVHPLGDESAHLQPLKLDKNAWFVLNIGTMMSYEKFVYRDLLSIKVMQGLFKDCSLKTMSVTSLTVKALIFENNKNRFYIAMGPAYLIRDSWTDYADDYVASGFWKVKNTERFGSVQYRMVGGLDLEYDRILNEKHSISISLTPGFPMASIFSFGWKYWMNYREFPDHKFKLP